MNERLRKLAEYAEDSAYIQTCRQFHENASGPSEEDIFRQKFAELIVLECLEIVNRKEYSYHEADPLWETAQLIKQHFGVE